jgi:hypothetical protein
MVVGMRFIPLFPAANRPSKKNCIRNTIMAILHPAILWGQGKKAADFISRISGTPDRRQLEWGIGQLAPSFYDPLKDGPGLGRRLPGLPGKDNGVNEGSGRFFLYFICSDGEIMPGEFLRLKR